MKNKDKVLDGFEGQLVEMIHKAIDANLKRHAAFLKRHVEREIKRTFGFLRGRK